MCLRSQANELAAQGAAFRQMLSGTPFLYQGKHYCGSFSAITSERDLQSGGWNLDIAATVRIARAAYPGFVPLDGVSITLTETGARYEISQIKDNPRSPEWILGLINPETAGD